MSTKLTFAPELRECCVMQRKTQRAYHFRTAGDLPDKTMPTFPARTNLRTINHAVRICVKVLLLGGFMVGASTWAAERRPDLFVAPDGKDTHPGTAAKPFATLSRAQEVVRQKIRAGLTKDLLVQIRGGIYPQTAGLKFGPDDSGTARFSITFAAAPGEKVICSGGRKISGWRKGAGEIWTADVPGVRDGSWYPRQLFINGQRAVRARTPNQGWCEGKPVQPIVQEATHQNVVIRIKVENGVANWGNPRDIELSYIRNNDGGRKVLESIDVAAQTVTLRPPHRWAPKCFGFDWYNGVPDGRCYLENAREFLDSPGEWYLDRSTGVLYYWPRPGEDLTQCEAVLPVAQNTLLAVTGTRQRPVLNLHFRGLHAEHVDWPLPDHGYMGLFSCNVPDFRDEGDPGHRFIDAAVEFKHARACSFRDGGVARAGGMGLVLREGTADIAVEGNVVQQIGGGGLGFGQCNVAGGYLKAAPPPEPGEYERFRVRNNHVHHCSLDYHGASGISAYRMRQSQVAHNLVHDVGYFGIVLAGDQDRTWNFMTGNAVERNHIHRAMQGTQDGAALYVCFAHTGGNTYVRGNLIHDTSTNVASGGLYLDSHCTGVVFDRNVLYRNPSKRTHGATIPTDSRMALILNHKADLAENTWTANLVLSEDEEAPPAEFVEAMATYAGLEAQYRKARDGKAPGSCELYVLREGVAWQFDFPDQNRGVVQLLRTDAAEGKADVGLKLQRLKPHVRYALAAYTAQVKDLRAVGEGKLLFPMVRGIAPATGLDLPVSASGRDLMNRGVTLRESPKVVWITYQKVVSKQ